MTAPITHADVVARVIEERHNDAPKAAKEFRANFKAWCSALGSSLDAPADQTLGTAYTSKLVLYQALLERTKPGDTKAGKNVRSAAARAQKTYLAMLASTDLPADFNAAFKAAMDRAGFTPAQLNRTLKQRFFDAERPKWYGAQIWGFYDGSAGPGRSYRGDSRLMLQRCEEVLGLEPNALISRAFPIVQPVRLGTFTEIPYRQARSAQISAQYAIKELPERIERIFRQYADWRFKEKHYINGQWHLVDSRARWSSKNSRKMGKEQFRRYVGWLCLPVSEKPLFELTPEERWRVGKGMNPDDVRMSHFLDEPLLLEYLEYQRSRQHNQVTTLTQSMFLELINTFISTPWCFLLGNPSYATEFGFEPATSHEEWAARVELRHQQMLKLINGIKRAAHQHQRNPDEPLKHVMEDADPYALMIEMIDRLEATPPLRANVDRWSIWARDVALFRMLADVPLRAKNIRDLKFDRNIKRDAESGRWRLFIPKSELKNHSSKFAEDINRQFSQAACEAIDRYVNEARQNLAGAIESSVFFLGASAGRRADAEFLAAADFKLSLSAIDDAMRKHLTTYFGVGQGVTIFRHMLATSILKDDPTRIEVAAAVLNNSAQAIRSSYKHLTQLDSLRLADNWFEEHRRRRQQKKRK